MRYVYLHGFASGPGTHKGQFFKQRLKSEGISLEIPDLTRGDFTHTTISKQLALIGEIIQASSEPVILLGSSLGGFLAALAAEQYSLVTGIFLIAPGFEFYRRRTQMMGEALLKQWEEQGEIVVYHYHLKKNVPIRYDFVRDAQQYDQMRFRRVLPAMIVHGLEDEVVPYEVSLHYLQQNPEAQCVLLHGDHGLLEQLPLIWSYFNIFRSQVLTKS